MYKCTFIVLQYHSLLEIKQTLLMFNLIYFMHQLQKIRNSDYKVRLEKLSADEASAKSAALMAKYWKERVKSYS